jgi:hypothetical protein
MKTNIILSVPFHARVARGLPTIVGLAAGLALSLTVIGCGGNGNGNGNGGSGGSGGGTGGPDMAMFTCVKAPTSDPDFLNACPPSGVDKVLITPTFPTLAPNGKLPTLQ